MISVEEARARIAAALEPLGTEMVPLDAALGRVLAEDVRARLTQPPARTSAMDGYAVRHADTLGDGPSLRVVGASPAGHPYAGAIGPGEAVRIFTGGAVPDDADTILIQEDTAPGGRDGVVRVTAAPAERGEHVLPAGGDFRTGQVGIAKGHRLGVRDVALAAAMNHPTLRVVRRPVIAVLSTGDEIARPGEPMRPGQIVSSNGPALCALIHAFGGVPRDLGIATDDRGSLEARAQDAQGADLLVTSGGASVGDHDLVGSVLGGGADALAFWKIAMRPGKPLMFGRCGAVPLLGLPGNPVSNLICGLLFLRGAIQALTGAPPTPLPEEMAVLGADLEANGPRAHYMRASLARDGAAAPVVRPAATQLSSRLGILNQAEALIVRQPRAGAARAGEPVTVIPFDRLDFHF